MQRDLFFYLGKLTKEKSKIRSKQLNDSKSVMQCVSHVHYKRKPKEEGWNINQVMEFLVLFIRPLSIPFALQ